MTLTNLILNLFQKNVNEKYTSLQVFNIIKTHYKGSNKNLNTSIASRLHSFHKKKELNRTKISNKYYYYLHNDNENLHNHNQNRQNLNINININNIDLIDDRNRFINEKNKAKIEYENRINLFMKNEFNNIINKIGNPNISILTNFISIKNKKKWFNLFDKIYWLNENVRPCILINIKNEKMKNDLKFKYLIKKLYNKKLLNNNKKKNINNLFKNYIKYKQISNKYLNLYNKIYTNNYPNIIINNIDLKIIKGNKNLYNNTSYNNDFSLDYYTENNKINKINTPIRWQIDKYNKPTLEIICINNRNIENEELLNFDKQNIIIKKINKKFKPTNINDDVFVKGNITKEFIIKHKNYRYLVYINKDSKINNFLNYVEFTVELIDIIIN